MLTPLYLLFFISGVKEDPLKPFEYFLVSLSKVNIYLIKVAISLGYIWPFKYLWEEALSFI